MGCYSSKLAGLRAELDQAKVKVKELETGPNLDKLQAELHNLPPAAATKLIAQFHEISQTATKHHKVAAASPHTSMSKFHEKARSENSLMEAKEMLAQYQAAYQVSSSSTADSLFEATLPQLSSSIGSTATEQAQVQVKEESAVVLPTLAEPTAQAEKSSRRRRSTGKSAPAAAPTPQRTAAPPQPAADTPVAVREVMDAMARGAGDGGTPTLHPPDRI